MKELGVYFNENNQMINTNKLHQEYAFINFFRALAAFWVVIAHSMIWGGWYGLPIPDPKMAVDLFMIISGYLMMAQSMNRNQYEPMTSHISWFRFWFRRFFRIAPAYYLSLFVAVLIGNHLLGGYHELQNMNPQQWVNTIVYNPLRIDYSLENIVLHITFLFGLHPQYSFSTFLPDWSLSLEMQFYFVFPFIFLFIKKWEVKRSLLLLGATSIVIALIVNKFLWFYEPSFLALKLQYFLVGIILYYLLNHKLFMRDKIILTLIAFFLLLAEHRFHSYGSSVLFVMMLATGWFETHQKLPSFLMKLLYSRFINFMSDSSYSVYLFHGFFISFSGLIISKIDLLRQASLFVHTVFIWLFVIVLVYPLAHLIFIFIEKKGVEYGRKFINRFFPILRRISHES